MGLKNLGAILATIAVLFIGNACVFAQSAPLGGMVQMEDKTPVKDALIEVYRSDINSGKPLTTKTDKRGNFIFAGVQVGGTFVVVVSAAGASPNLLGGIRAGQDKLVIVLTKGDGKKYTPEEVMSTVKSGSQTGVAATPSESADSKKAKAEFEKQKAEVENKNKKIEESNTIVINSLTAGNNAFNAKNFDLAVVEYSKGIDADPTHPGAPVLLSNRAQALRVRAVNKFNAALGIKDNDQARNAGIEEAKKDWTASSESSNRAVQLIKETPVPTDPNSLKNYESAKYNALSERAEGMRLFATKVDQSKYTDGLVAYQEYMAVETDPVKKTKAQLAAAQMVMDSGNVEPAVPEFRKVLVMEAENLDALAGLGLALISNGYVSNDKAQFQEGVNFLQRYVDLAPEGHKFKSDAKATIDSIKNEQKIAPQKTTGGAKKPVKGKN